MKLWAILKRRANCTFLLIPAVLFLLTTICHGDILLDQAPDTAEFAFAEHVLTDAPLVTSYIVDDLTLASSTGKGFVIDSVTTYFRINGGCLLYTSPSPRDATLSRMPSSA